MEKINFQKIVDLTKEDGGYTSEDLAGCRYIVSEPGSEFIVKLNDFTAKKLESILKLFQFNDGLGWGTWLDNSTGLVYIDINAGYNNEAEALEKALENNQLAYYDTLKGEEIRTGLTR